MHVRFSPATGHRTPGKERSVSAGKNFQRSRTGSQTKIAWREGGEIVDAAELFNNALDRECSGAGENGSATSPAATDSREELIRRIKAIQRASAASRNLWWQWCECYGGGVRDPGRCTGKFLHGFLDALASGWRPVHNASHGSHGEACDVLCEVRRARGGATIADARVHL